MTIPDAALVRVLTDKIYEKRKATALELEKLVRDCHQNSDANRINQIIEQLIDLFVPTSNALHVRNGGLIGLAATAIALGVEIAPYMPKFMDPLLACFSDLENRVRYFACESMYNIAKVSKGEILIYFNPIFDALSKLVADSELSVKNGAELLDRLLRDIVSESASVYIPQYPETIHVRLRTEDAYELGVLVEQPGDPPFSRREDSRPRSASAKKAFSLAHFIPLLADRMYVVNPFTRSWLVGWVTVLDSVPDLELVTFLPDLLDNLLKYLSDPMPDVKVATENLLADFLREVREVTSLQKRYEAEAKVRREAELREEARRAENESERLPDITMTHSERAMFVPENGGEEWKEKEWNGSEKEVDHRDTGTWIPGQGVAIDHAAIVEILISQFDSQHDEIQRSTGLRWVAEFLDFAQETMIPFTPRLIPVILPNLAHHVEPIRNAAIRTDQLLYNAIQSQPSPSDHSALPVTAPTRQTGHPTGTVTPSNMMTTLPESTSPQPSRPQSPAAQSVHSPVQGNTIAPSPSLAPEDIDLIDYQATVNVLTVQFLSEHEQTRVAALKWLIMLHQKAPKKILAMDDGTFPALLKTLSDSSEEVIKHDLRLLAQISSRSEEGYFKTFMENLLGLFSTDRRLLDLRGSLIIRQLCVSLNAERIYRTFAEILEKEEDLEFASVMVQKLNIILITSPELLEFRKRLKNLETRQDGQALFTTLYRSWCHNPVAVFSLCLLAQAYEHASNLLTIFADLEITVSFLVQIDKLVQLIESPVFTYLRLQLLEPEKFPYLFKCLYGLLMLLPQSSAFTSLQKRLTAVSSMGFLQIAPRGPPSTATTRSKLARDDIKWQDLISHFRTVQSRHEKARRQAFVGDLGPSGFTVDTRSSTSSSNLSGRPPLRRRVSEVPTAVPTVTVPARASALSPLNPKARPSSSQNLPQIQPQSGLLSPAAANGRMSPTLPRQKPRTISQNRTRT
ncbi:vacuolar protein 14 C-terminal Fig4p binding-domain-containing protein [Hysterangium stoloniferum]|nr:vacuolar protein 14 C-terminal Fig4p binding-domain-containing protein [Hysterangium stoloniferum]